MSVGHFAALVFLGIAAGVLANGDVWRAVAGAFALTIGITLFLKGQP